MATRFSFVFIRVQSYNVRVNSYFVFQSFFLCAVFIFIHVFTCVSILLRIIHVLFVTFIRLFVC